MNRQQISIEEMKWARETENHLKPLNDDFRPLRAVSSDEIDGLDEMQTQTSSHIRLQSYRSWNVDDNSADIVLIPLLLN